MKGDVPLILGMDFLVKTSPFVDWKRRIVTCYVGTTKYNLPTCKINDIDSICDDNTFAGLYVDNDIDSSENKLSLVTSDTKHSKHAATVHGC